MPWIPRGKYRPSYTLKAPPLLQCPGQLYNKSGETEKVREGDVNLRSRWNYLVRTFANLLSPLKTGPKTDLIVFTSSYGENKTSCMSKIIIIQLRSSSGRLWVILFRDGVIYLQSDHLNPGIRVLF